MSGRTQEGRQIRKSSVYGRTSPSRYKDIVDSNSHSLSPKPNKDMRQKFYNIPYHVDMLLYDT